MFKGGYQIVDFKGSACTLGTKNTNITSAFTVLGKTNGKPVRVHGLKVGTTLHTDFYALFTPVSTTYVACVKVTDELEYKIVVEATGVTVTNLLANA
jgi:hypothetical protein